MSLPLTPADAKDVLRQALDAMSIGKRWIDRERLAAAIPQIVSVTVVGGQHVTVTASDTIDTGLANVGSAVAILESDPIAAAQFCSCQIGDQAGAPAAGSIIIRTWEMDGINPVAATTFGKKVNWIAIAAS